MLHLLALLILQSSPAGTELAAMTVDQWLDDDLAAFSVLQPGAECDRVMAANETLNSPALFYGAARCFAADREIDAYSLMHFGQVRSMVDMESTMDADLPPPEPVIRLYGALFYQLGGTAPMTLYADAATRDALLQRLAAWTPQITPTYQPGWSTAKPIDVASYLQSAADQRDARLAQLSNLARLAQIPEYTALSSEFSVLQAENPEGFVVGTPAYERSSAISARLRELSEESH
jgi:hypothetical protein